MSTYYTIRTQNGSVAAEANTLQGAQLAKRILEAETGEKLAVYGPEHATHQRALEALR